MQPQSRVPSDQLRDYALSRGISSLTLDQVVEITGLSRSAATETMRRTRGAGAFFAPVPGLYIPIPGEFSLWGVVPAMDFIDQMMAFLGRSYYVCLLSAADLHGAAHQKPQIFQVMVDRKVADRDIERVALRFYERAELGRIPVVRRTSRTAQVPVSTPEATVLDLAARPSLGAGLDNVATIVGEMAGEDLLDPSKLVGLASAYPLAVVRRVGWLLDHVAFHTNTAALSEPLQQYLARHTNPNRRAVDLLSPGSPRRGRTNTRWGLVENRDVESDL